MKISRVLMALLILGGAAEAGLVKEYVNKKYSQLCKYSNIVKYRENEKALSIVGVSCVKIDNLYLLPYIINDLKHTAYGRKNAIYFGTLFMEKKLLYSYLFDNISLEGFSFPLTDYILSKIFNAVKYGNYDKEGNEYIINLKNKKYILYTNEDKMMLDEYVDNKLVKRRWYR